MAAPRANDRSAFACWRIDRSTTVGMTPCSAGNVNALTVPLTASITMMFVTVACPVMNSAAAPAWDTPDARCEICSTRPRGKRSATTPPKSMNAAIGIVCAARTAPNAPGELEMSRTANASAMVTSEEPNIDTVRPTNSQRKWLSRSGARLSTAGP